MTNMNTLFLESQPAPPESSQDRPQLIETTLSPSQIVELEAAHAYHDGMLAPEGTLFTVTGELVDEQDAVLVYESPLNVPSILDLEPEAPAHVRIPGIDPLAGDQLATIADKHLVFAIDAEEKKTELPGVASSAADLSRIGLHKLLETGRKLIVAPRRVISHLGRTGIIDSAHTGSASAD